MHSVCICVYKLQPRNSTEHMPTQSPPAEAHGAAASRTAPAAAPPDPWCLNGAVVGAYVPAATLRQLPGLAGLEGAVLHLRKLRQLAPGTADAQGRDIGGFYVVSDIGAVLLFKYARSAYKWAKRLTREIAPSLSAVESGSDAVSPARVCLLLCVFAAVCVCCCVFAAVCVWALSCVYCS